MKNKNGFGGVKELLNKREKLLKAEEFYLNQFIESKATKRKVAQMKYWGVINHIKAIDFEITVLTMKLENKGAVT